MKPMSKLSLAVLAFVFSSGSFAAQMKVLPDNTKALQTRIDLIKSAEKEILIEYFEVAQDKVTLAGLGLLQEAARRGVKVKIIVDNMHSMIFPKQFGVVMENLYIQRTNNFEIKVFNPLNVLNPFDQTYRNHDKLFVVDGRYAIIGGRNVSGSYFGRAENGLPNLRDVDVLISGEEVQVPQKYFHTLWKENDHVKTRYLHEYSVDGLNDICMLKNSESSDHCEGKQKAAKENIVEEQQKITALVDLVNSDRGAFGISPKVSKDLFANMHNVDMTFMYNDPKVVMKEVKDRLGEQLYRDLLQAKPETLTIVTPYLFPPDSTLDLFENLIRNQGTKIKIITNSLRSNDSMLVHAAFETIKPRLVKMGVELYEYNGPLTNDEKNQPEILHAKMMVLNENTEQPTSYIGSFNMDHRSVYINRELGIKISGRETKRLANEMLEQIKDIQANSTMTAKDGTEVLNALDYLMSLPDPLNLYPAKRENADRNKGLVKLLRKHI